MVDQSGPKSQPVQGLERFALPDMPAGTAMAQGSVVTDPSLYINRELSWLEFNARVLEAATDPAVPLYERLKFLGIFSSNLDEFFMVRVAGLQAQLSGEVDDVPPDGLTPRRQLIAVAERAQQLVREQYRVWRKTLSRALREIGVALVVPSELSPEDQQALDAHFERDIFPVLTPIAIDPAHPFPHVRNRAITVGILFEPDADPIGSLLGVVQVPGSLPRLIRVPLQGMRRAFVALEDIILRNRAKIFPQMTLAGQFAFRVTRDFDIEIDEDEAEDLLLILQAELRRHAQSRAVRLEITSDAPEYAVESLCQQLNLDPQRDVYRVDGPLVLADMVSLAAGDERQDLRDERYMPQYVPPLRDSDDFFTTIREQDVLLHHPYESFEAVVDFLSQAAEDPQVLAIKQTLYRTGGESPLVQALQRAAENGKQVTVLVELKARFDEQSNIKWARTLERSGVNVVYGLLGLKTHAKVLLVVRKEGKVLRRYVHLATGNYNRQTARLYEDVSLFTARDDFGEDATALFNLLTSCSAPDRLNRLVVAPFGLREVIIGLIQREAEHARAGRVAGIVAKLNSVVDARVITALYAASQDGVKIDLMVRGICCLRPGVKGVSKGIRVTAVIDRFLEHARVIHFRNGGKDEVYCSSADWMPRSFLRRVETLFPIVDDRLRQRIVSENLSIMRADNVATWKLTSDGRYRRLAPADDEPRVRSQQRFMELARQRGRQLESLGALGSPAGLTRASAPGAPKRFAKRRRKRKQRQEDG